MLKNSVLIRKKWKSLQESLSYRLLSHAAKTGECICPMYINKFLLAIIIILTDINIPTVITHPSFITPFKNRKQSLNVDTCLQCTGLETMHALLASLSVATFRERNVLHNLTHLYVRLRDGQMINTVARTHKLYCLGAYTVIQKKKYLHERS